MSDAEREREQERKRDLLDFAEQCVRTIMIDALGHPMSDEEVQSLAAKMVEALPRRSVTR